jgi:hypothetical protein
MSMANLERKSVMVVPWSIRFEEKGRNCIIGSLNDTTEYLYVSVVASNCTQYLLFLSQRLVYHLADSNRSRSEICNRSSNCIVLQNIPFEFVVFMSRKKSHGLWGRQTSRCKIPFPLASCCKTKLAVASKIYRITANVILDCWTERRVVSK